ncbi:MAG TPA: NifB/NifX family molybdenum-iron cluster-binding protein [Methanocella sp.]|nr:NifB/NifX family molybdenum-iron cluster-binding protein [Methanocella sp.]
MKICVPMKGTMVHNHFGKAPEFMMLTVEERKIVLREVVKNPGREKGAVLELMPAHGVTHVIAGGMGERARNILKEKNVAVVTGALGSIDNAVDRFLKGELKPVEVPCCGDNLCGK